jgi:hypothetical protein
MEGFSALCDKKYSKERKLWRKIQRHHNIARAIRALKVSNPLPVNAQSAAKLKKSFQMNLIGLIPVVVVVSPSILLSVNWKAKAKVFRHAKGLRRI